MPYGEDPTNRTRPALSLDPPITAVLLAAHGDGGDWKRNDSVRAVAERLARRLDLPVDWAVLKEPETFAAARTRLGAAAEGTVAVYPFFMADGYFVRERLPQRLAASGFATVERLTPFGLDPRLVDLIEHRLRAVAALQGGRVPADFRILMVAHGSGTGQPASRQRAEAVAAELGWRGLGSIHLGFIEEAPFVGEAFAAVDPEIVLGFFASEGTHALDDVATLVAERPGILHHVAAIGTDLEVADLVARAVEDCISRKAG